MNPIIVGIYYNAHTSWGSGVYSGSMDAEANFLQSKSYSIISQNPDGSRIFIDESELLEMFLKEPIDIWVNSFGGARSNFIVNLLEQKYVIQNEAHRAKGAITSGP